MYWEYLAVIFVLGLLIGSFLNVCIYRLPRPGKSPLRGFSHCPRCQTPIKWYDNLPLLSYLLLRGKCRACRQPISFRYPLVELLTALLFSWAAYQLTEWDYPQIIRLVINLYLLGALVITTFVDLEFRIIPDEISIGGIVLAPIVSLLFPALHEPLAFLQFGNVYINSLMTSLAGMIMGGGVVYLIGFFGKLVFRKEAMGLGDVKLMCFLGGFLGYESIIFVFLLACIIGSVAGIVLWLITKDHYMAFGPYLALGAVIIIFFKKAVTRFAYVTYPEFLRQIFGL
jgi:leader peptidase (prepilin peptidase)/N-methyltransferase